MTLPLLSPTTWMVTLVSIIYVARTFNEVYAMFVSYSGNTAGSGNAAITVMYYIYWMFFCRPARNSRILKARPFQMQKMDSETIISPGSVSHFFGPMPSSSRK